MSLSERIQQAQRSTNVTRFNTEITQFQQLAVRLCGQENAVVAQAVREFTARAHEISVHEALAELSRQLGR